MSVSGSLRASTVVRGGNEDRGLHTKYRPCLASWCLVVWGGRGTAEKKSKWEKGRMKLIIKGESQGWRVLDRACAKTLTRESSDPSLIGRRPVKKGKVTDRALQGHVEAPESQVRPDFVFP